MGIVGDVEIKKYPLISLHLLIPFLTHSFLWSLRLCVKSSWRLGGYLTE